MGVVFVGNRPRFSWVAMWVNVRRRQKKMTTLHVGDVCFQRRVGGNVSGKLIRSSLNERQYVCRAFCAFVFQSGRLPTFD